MVLQTRIVTTAAPPPSVVPPVVNPSVQTSMSNSSSSLILSSRSFVAFLLSSSALLFSFFSAKSNMEWMLFLDVFQGVMRCCFGSRANTSSFLTLSNSFAILLQLPRHCLYASWWTPRRLCARTCDYCSSDGVSSNCWNCPRWGCPGAAAAYVRGGRKLVTG